MSKDNAIGIGIGLLAGLVIGGVVAVLYAPKSGKDCWRIIVDIKLLTQWTQSRKKLMKLWIRSKR
jgi:gas vesicle protein